MTMSSLIVPGTCLTTLHRLLVLLSCLRSSPSCYVYFARNPLSFLGNAHSYTPPVHKTHCVMSPEWVCVIIEFAEWECVIIQRATWQWGAHTASKAAAFHPPHAALSTATCRVTKGARASHGIAESRPPPPLAPLAKTWSTPGWRRCALLQFPPPALALPLVARRNCRRILSTNGGLMVAARPRIRRLLWRGPQPLPVKRRWGFWTMSRPGEAVWRLGLHIRTKVSV